MSEEKVEQWNFQVQHLDGGDKSKRKVQIGMLDVLRKLHIFNKILPKRIHLCSFGFLIYHQEDVICLPLELENQRLVASLQNYIEVGSHSTTTHKITLEVQYAREDDDRRKMILDESKLRIPPEITAAEQHKLVTRGELLLDLYKWIPQTTEEVIEPVDAVTELVYRATIAILHYRGVCHREYFKFDGELDDTFLYSLQNKETNDFILSALRNIEDCLRSKILQKIELLIINKNSEQIVEEWNFEVHHVDGKDKSKLEIRNEMLTILRKIRKCRSMFPKRIHLYSFGFLIYHQNCMICLPLELKNVDLKWILPPSNILLGSLSTSIHRITLVVRHTKDTKLKLKEAV
ncbi:hypothetical protein ILUMI_02538 [Ignelater luminosus]|uniref:HORMA domain-containing protein n=1 Tax=Ignelater luminosus TaxID=2038154 RepID=A0A8K0DHZ4_IGNLU|nr:hypothetical protein ILUMI_02538 [Ignelater luminosus]